MEKHTYLYNQGYRFYVYLGPGKIQYFFGYEKAKNYAEQNNAEVQTLN